jgi:GNAT superfamily N-acetyltransferase
VTAADGVEVRQAGHDDREAVVDFTQDTWPELGGDYIPDVFEEWVDTDGPEQHTFVAAVDDRPVGVLQAVLLSDHEAWAQGMRVAPEFRGASVGRRLSRAAFEWAAVRDATVCRSMVFSWNAAGLGQARAVGFEPVAEFRWLEPNADPEAPRELAVGNDPAVAWSTFRGSDADRHLRGLGLDLEESWALAEVTERRLGVAESTLALRGEDRRRAMTYRTRTFEREDDEGAEETWAEYGVAAWEDHEALSELAAAIARDAAAAGADRARVLVPETPRHVSDAARARVPFVDEPDFVLERDLTGYGGR